MLSTPNGLLPSGNESTAVRRCVDLGLSATLARLESGLSPHGNLRPLVPRAAFSHSFSLGKRLPAHLAKFVASSKVTLTTGSSGSPTGALQPCCLQNVA